MPGTVRLETSYGYLQKQIWFLSEKKVCYFLNLSLDKSHFITEVTSMRKILTCEFNLDTACVELRLDDGTLISIDCTVVDNELANSMYQRSELDWLIYNDPLAYAELILNGDSELYLKAVTKKTPLD